MTTKQEILNIVVPAMREQQRPAMSAGGQCLYRGPGGTKCAVGFILTDEEAAILARADDKGSPYSEGILGADEEFWDARPDLREHKQFLIELQEAHDERAEDVGSVIDEEEWFYDWETRAEKVAKEYGLEWPSV